MSRVDALSVASGDNTPVHAHSHSIQHTAFAAIVS